MIPKKAKHPKEAWELAKYLSGVEPMKEYAAATGMQVPRPDVNPYPDDQMLQTVLKNLPNGYGAPPVPQLQELQDTWFSEFEALLLCKKSGEQAVKDMATRINQALEQ